MAIVVFVGRDSSHHYNLWVTDGTTAGTTELTGVSGANTGGLIDASGGQINGDLTLFNGEVLFDGEDTSGAVGLWVSNGTAAGTYELTGIANANSFGLRSSVIQEFPTQYNIAVLNGEAVFAGIDASNFVGLWVSDGTAAGTHELTGISGEYTGGFDPEYLTVLNGEVLFDGTGSDLGNDLWETNGTAAGTIEIAGPKQGLSTPNDLIAFNNEVLFQGIDGSGNRGLWVSNETTAGTQELTGISGARANFDPTDLTVFGNEVIFSAVDSGGVTGLWVTDGTVAGTHELTGISGASTSGLSPKDLTVFNGEVLFSGRDASGDTGLWVTNGTAAGTTELTGISGAYASLNPTDLTLFNGEVIFSGLDSNGLLNLWLTNGTAAGTHEITGVGGADSYYGVSPSFMTVIPCYCPGTLIRTKYGQKKVEELKIGDKLMTSSGEERPIKWIGRRSYSRRFVMGRRDILPVCIKAGALDDDVPKRDLWISPNHAMYLDGMLIEAKDLINGASIVQAESVVDIEYFHVELETHDIIVAEGAAAESYVDDDNRLMFHNAHEYREKYANVPVGPARYCAPRCDAGYEVEAVRQRITLRAGLTATEDPIPIGALRGYIELITDECIAGWAQHVDHPEAPVCLDILVSGALVGQVLANRHREDLERAGIGSGCHSFKFAMPQELVFAPDEVEVRRSLDGVALEPTSTAWRMLRQDTSGEREAMRAVA